MIDVYVCALAVVLRNIPYKLQSILAENIHMHLRKVRVLYKVVVFVYHWLALWPLIMVLLSVERTMWNLEASLDFL